MASLVNAEGDASYEPTKAHAEADANGDGMIDRAEFHERMVEIFFHGDRDKDGYMTWAELEKVVLLPDDFRGADRNSDGRISLHEFIRVRFDDYDIVDTNGDGLLSVAEVVAVFARGGVR
jgi:Ca2+-binding EF-hand superfamily protein